MDTINKFILAGYWLSIVIWVE